MEKQSKKRGDKYRDSLSIILLQREWGVKRQRSGFYISKRPYETRAGNTTGNCRHKKIKEMEGGKTMTHT